MASIVGPWNILVTWRFGWGAGTEFNAIHATFNADGTWTDRGNHRGRWMRDGDQVVWSQTAAESFGLVYSAHIPPDHGHHGLPHEDTMQYEGPITGIMGWLDGRNLGSFRALRPQGAGEVHFASGGVPFASGGVPETNFDPVLGRVDSP